MIGMVMIAFVGVATFDKSGTGATSILQSVIQVSPKRRLKNVTLASSCSYYASCAAARSAAVGALGSQPVVMTYRIPRHIGCSPHRSKYLGEEPFYVRLSGADGGVPTAALALGVVVLGLIQPTNPVRGLYTEVIAQKA
jgi:hypothetical protein